MRWKSHVRFGGRLSVARYNNSRCGKSTQPYELSDFITESGDAIDFDSYMIPESDLELGQFRLLEVDNRLIIPVDCHIRFIITGKHLAPIKN